MEDIFTVFQASKYCNVSPKTIINWIDAGHIEAYRTVGGHRRIKRSDMEDFMRKQGMTDTFRSTGRPSIFTKTTCSNMTVRPDG